MPSTTVWYCCGCGYGPCNYSIDDYCPDCQRRRCGACKIARISNRYNYSYQLQGVAETNPYPEVFTAAGFDTNTYDIHPLLRPFKPSHGHHERISLALRPSQLPPTLLDTGHQVLTDSPSIGDIFQHGGLKNSRPVTYYCCQCNDGPKLYANQPRCVSCNHVVCGNCKP
uniref:Synaptotagmin-like protein 4 n=1 Tax=Talaromyces marneffei PM1 TaxID=1077442 RepID=A0A093UVB6_TALMA